MNKLTLYVVRNTARSTPYKTSGRCERERLSSAPCSNCFKKIQEIGIKKLVYINDDGEIICCKTKNYQTNWKSSGYRIYERQKIKIN